MAFTANEQPYYIATTATYLLYMNVKYHFDPPPVSALPPSEPDVPPVEEPPELLKPASPPCSAMLGASLLPQLTRHETPSTATISQPFAAITPTIADDVTRAGRAPALQHGPQSARRYGLLDLFLSNRNGSSRREALLL